MTSAPGMNVRVVPIVVGLAFAAACGGTSASRWTATSTTSTHGYLGRQEISSIGGSGSGMGSSVESPPAPPQPGRGNYSFEDDNVSGDLVAPSGVAIAQARPRLRTPNEMPVPSTRPEPQDQSQPTANDAVHGPLLIYTGNFVMAVNDVPTMRARVGTIAREANGFVGAEQDDMIRVRVPAAKFQEVVAAIEQVGDVLSRSVESQDITEEFLDLEIRLRNAEAFRTRLEALLTRAEKVEDALAVQEQLRIITEQIEQMKGRMRFFQDRVAFSTIEVRFRARAQEAPDTIFRPPYGWLSGVGVGTLLNLGGSR